MFSYKEKVRIRQMLKEGAGWWDCLLCGENSEHCELRRKSWQREGEAGDTGREFTDDGAKLEVELNPGSRTTCSMMVPQGNQVCHCLFILTTFFPGVYPVIRAGHPCASMSV